MSDLGFDSGSIGSATGSVLRRLTGFLPSVFNQASDQTLFQLTISVFFIPTTSNASPKPSTRLTRPDPGPQTNKLVWAPAVQVELDCKSLRAYASSF